MKTSVWILPVIVISQFFCTSVWFAGNAVLTELVSTFHLGRAAIADLTSAVQLGFIAGTLIFAMLTIADRFSPSKIFFFSALIAAIFNLGTIYENNGSQSLFGLRFLTGFFLAGIYPVGMKIAADYYKKGLDKTLGYLVGALVLGTALPHLIKGIDLVVHWHLVIKITSALAVFGGLLLLILVPDGPYRKQGKKLSPTALFHIFKNPPLRSAALGYFGHMWELYAFWAFVPVILATYNSSFSNAYLNVPLYSFLIIGVGALACVLAGYLSQRFGARLTAFTALSISCFCCLFSPVLFLIQSESVFLAYMILWGMAVVADSPLFSTLIAENTSAQSRGSTLTLVNSIGFAITIVSLQLLNIISYSINMKYMYVLLAVGPVFGLLSLYGKNIHHINRS